MIKDLNLVNVGPKSEMDFEFASRLNLLTGDNGLGKSFLLDIAWWALTRRWPADLNPRLTSGNKIVPAGDGEAKIGFSFKGKNTTESYDSHFRRKEQAWTGRPGRPANPGLVLYAMSDGSFAVWDPHRNYWTTRDGQDVQDRVPAYVFNPNEVWEGLQDERGVWLCNGLIRDWAGWQKEDKAPFAQLKKVLQVLSPSENELLEPGELTRISLDDVRDIPTIRMPYLQEVAVIHASSGIRRIMALAYFLVWAWQEHSQAAKQLGEPPTEQVTFLIDEIESHLHPSWQRRIVPTLLSVMGTVSQDAHVQLIAATHSPLIMASVEPFFNRKIDAWYDLDFENQRVQLTRREFEKHGDVAAWLTSEAFDLKSGRPVEYESLVLEAAQLMEGDATLQEIAEMHQKLLKALGPKDPFLFRWRSICERKGWLP